jgi:orotate phosphoribosyltransferase-like protein
VRKLALMAEQVGIDIDTLIGILNAGVPMASVLDLIQSRLEARSMGRVM